MNSIKGRKERNNGFTIVELLTVMSVIVILIGLLVPALNKVKRYAKDVKQKAQFHAIDVAMELFSNENDGYPPSDKLDEVNRVYCGAQKLAEAMMGQDLVGFHPDSHFRRDGTLDGTASTQLYPDAPDPMQPWYENNLKARKGPYLQLENANANKLSDIYTSSFTQLDSDRIVLCDVYNRVQHATTGKRVGMPILYYKANTANTGHSKTYADSGSSIYNYHDNDVLLTEGGIPKSSYAHPMASSGSTSSGATADVQENFYDRIWNEDITTVVRPYRADSYILLSAGFDGEYGTSDDIYNFEQ